MSQCTRLWILASFLLVLLSPPINGKGGGTSWTMKRRKVEKRGITLKCSSSAGGGHIVDVSVAGVIGKCRGLTARMFVEMTSCLWKEECLITKSKGDNYMVKLDPTSPASCIAQQAKKFSVSYQCAAADVKILDVLGNSTVEVSEVRGIIRSHEYHPWLYTDQGEGSLTLRNPSSPSVRYVALAYTIRTLRLMYDDVLRVTSKGRSPKFVEYSNDIISAKNDVIEDEPESVTFELETSQYSTGGEGFVLCFQWVTEAKKMNACSEMVSPGPKPRKKRQKPKKGGKGKKDKTNKNKKDKSKRKKKNKKNKKSPTGDNPS